MVKVRPCEGHVKRLLVFRKKRDTLSAELILGDILKEVGAPTIETEIWATSISLDPARQKNYLQQIPGEKKQGRA